MTESLLDQIREALGDIAEGVPEPARDVYEPGSVDGRAGRESSPAVTRHGGLESRSLGQRVMDNPWAWLLAAGGLGYSLAWMIYRSRGEERNRHSRVGHPPAGTLREVRAKDGP